MSHRHRARSTTTWTRDGLAEECSCGATKTSKVTATATGRGMEHGPWIVGVVNEWKAFIVYGSWTLESGENYFVVRMPAGRQPWSKKIAPAINKLVATLPGSDRFWAVQGEAEGEHLWARPLGPRYEWNGVRLVRV